MEHLKFLHEEFVNMIAKSQWLVLPAEAMADLPGLRVSPPGVVVQSDRRPRWICNYTWSQVNQETLPLALFESMQFGHALDGILRELLLADPALGPVHLLKLDVSNGFYRCRLFNQQMDMTNKVRGRNHFYQCTGSGGWEPKI